jgi:hypothetical protein
MKNKSADRIFVIKKNVELLFEGLAGRVYNSTAMLNVMYCREIYLMTNYRTLILEIDHSENAFIGT